MASAPTESKANGIYNCILCYIIYIMYSGCTYYLYILLFMQVIVNRFISIYNKMLYNEF